jgi:hypothetical protein
MARRVVLAPGSKPTSTLTGLAERSHLLTPDTNLDTHILDVVNENEVAGVE